MATAQNILWLILLWAIAVNEQVLASSVVLSDVNNMLRDAKAASSKETAKNPTNFGAQEKSSSSASSASASTSSVELLRFVDDNTSEDVNSLEILSNGQTLSLNQQNGVAAAAAAGDHQHLTLTDQVRVLTKQLNALMTRRREDYEMLEHNLRKSLRLTADAANVDADVRSELEQLRHEVATLRAAQSGNKERLTVEWLQQSISEIRKQLVELQRSAGNMAKDVQIRSAGYEDLATIRHDYEQLQLELTAQRERQQQTEVYVQELREEIMQQEQDFRHQLNKQTQSQTRDSASIEETSQELSGDHKRRHCRFQSEQIHALQVSHRGLRRQLNELKYHRIDERVRSLELEQHRIANANFNLSRQIATLDKLHTSMLELLEDVEGLQTKMDKNFPEFRHEISKLEFANAQISSEQNLVREENKNEARSLQAMAVSVSALQDEREGVKKLVSNVAQLQTNVDRLQSMVGEALEMQNKNKMSHLNKPHKHPQIPQAEQDSALAETLVAELENVESQYEAIIQRLPHDCSEVSQLDDGLHLIAPAGQHHPLMTHCSSDGWTTIQRRFDGSADFNRSWVDYSNGFGAPGGEFWIGNEQLHHLTLNNCSQLRVHMQDIYDNVWVAEYGYFYISSRSDGYRLHIGDYSGNASDALNYQQGMQFSAIDDDRDISQTHCAANYEGGWWFSHCQHANLNGRYNLGLTWFDAARNEWIAVKSSQMLVKPRPAGECPAPALATVDSSSSLSTPIPTSSPSAVAAAAA
ncbi:protein scabrous [Drosophila tropicalis]|uniref:protein scabrous n=1 Tax=Drosophila tropicalis TaxID=46794 RepID=UPI0035AB6906